MKKSLVTLLLLISSKQILACDYYEDKSVISKTLDTGIYHKNISGVVCSPNKTMTIPIKNGKVEGLYKEYYKSGALWYEANYKNGKKEGLAKEYYESGALRGEANYKNGKPEGLVKEYYESGALKSEVNFKDGIRVSGKCANGREWTDAELSNFEKGLEVSCGD